MKKNILCLIGLLVLTGLTGCCRTKTAASASANTSNYILIDVRSTEEYASGHLEGAVNMPHDTIGTNISASAPDKDSEIYLYCRSGRRVKAAMDSLSALGYKNLRSLGGMDEAQQTTGRKIVKTQ